MIGNQNQHQILKILKTLIKIQCLINLNLENLRKKRKNNTKNTSLEKIQTSTNKIEEHMQGQICLVLDGKHGGI
jgi:hypothetical protein